jgi:hypothetical protein
VSTPEFDLEHWISIFPIQTIRSTDPWSVKGYSITSPFHLAVVEQIRREVSQTSNLGQAIPTDVFAFGSGDGPNRAGTKIGGLPYRPAAVPWPSTRDDGREMTFVGQLNFRDSTDLAGPLPGDILLIFTPDDEAWGTGDPDAFRFEWYTEGVADLIASKDVPEPAWSFPVCYGVRSRTADFPDSKSLFDEYRGRWRIAVLEGTKIGGVPPFLDEINASGAVSGKFLASIGSVKPESDYPYPWINRKIPQDGECDWLMWGDLGVLSLFLHDDGNIQWWIECY